MPGECQVGFLISNVILMLDLVFPTTSVHNSPREVSASTRSSEECDDILFCPFRLKYLPWPSLVVPLKMSLNIELFCVDLLSQSMRLDPSDEIGRGS